RASSMCIVLLAFFVSVARLPPSSTLFPYTTLFRSEQARERIAALEIPEVSIYQLDTMSDFTKRYLVPEMQEALTPEESMKLVQVPVDFEVQLFAAEPDITNPIAMAWDERGRLWIVESVDYPNTFVETDGAANDRIKICEDTDGDGKADKFTVFADS